MPPETKDLQNELEDLVGCADESAWALSEALGRDGKWLGRKLKGERRVYKSDIHAVRDYIETDV